MESSPSAAAPADSELQRLVASLPEVYQPILGYPEFSAGASRDCEPRWETIAGVNDQLAAALGQPPRVLDLGCAQGWFSLQLARRGARVRGFDIHPANVAVCQALAARNPGLDIEFGQAAIEEVVPQLADDGFDLVLGLSVFHHLCAARGQEFVRALLARILDKIPHALLELALAGEPPAWARALPANPDDLLDPIPFFRVLARHPTHLSELPRPLYFCSRTHWLLGGAHDFQPFTRWSHAPGRRVYAGRSLLAKLYLDQPAEARTLAQEAAFLEAAPAHLPPQPRLVEQGRSEGRLWMVAALPAGDTLAGRIRHGYAYDADAVLRQALAQLAAWERFGLFDPDLRAAHVRLDAAGAPLVATATLIADRSQLPWPPQPFVSFWIFAYELLNRVELPSGPVEPRFYHHGALPSPYGEWSMQFWALPMAEWSFERLLAMLPGTHSPAAAPSAFTAPRRRDGLLAPLGYNVCYLSQPKYRGAASSEVCIAARDGADYYAVLDAGHFERLRSIQREIPHMVPVADQVEDCFLFPRAAGSLLWDSAAPPDLARLEAELLAFAEATRRHGLVHADLRPWNVFFDPERGTQVIDWGHGGFVDELRLDSFALGHIRVTNHGECRLADLASVDLEDARRLLALLRGEIGLKQAWGHEHLAWLPPWCRP